MALQFFLRYAKGGRKGLRSKIVLRNIGTAPYEKINVVLFDESVLLLRNSFLEQYWNLISVKLHQHSLVEYNSKSKVNLCVRTNLVHTLLYL